MHAAMTNQQLIDSGNRMMDKTDQAIGGHKRLDYLSWSFFEEISFIYFGELKRDKFCKLFWSVIIISSHSSLFPYRRLQVELYLVFLKVLVFLALPWTSLALVCIKTRTNYGMFILKCDHISYHSSLFPCRRL